MQRCLVNSQALCIFDELLRHHKTLVCTQRRLHLEWPSLTRGTKVILKSKVLNVSQRSVNIGWKEANVLTREEPVSRGTSELEIRAQ